VVEPLPLPPSCRELEGEPEEDKELVAELLSERN